MQSLPLAPADLATVQEIATALPARWPILSLILYGSKARGEDTPDSGTPRRGVSARLAE